MKTKQQGAKHVQSLMSLLEQAKWLTTAVRDARDEANQNEIRDAAVWVCQRTGITWFVVMGAQRGQWLHYSFKIRPKKTCSSTNLSGY